MVEVEVANHGGFTTHAFAEFRIGELDAFAQGLFVVKEEKGFTNFTLLDDKHIVQESNKLFLRAVGFVAGKAVPLNGVLAKEVLTFAADISLGYPTFSAVFYASGLGLALEVFAFILGELRTFRKGAGGLKGFFNGLSEGAV